MNKMVIATTRDKAKSESSFVSHHRPACIAQFGYYSRTARIAAFVLASCLSGPAGQSTPRLPKPVIESITTLLQRKMAEAKIPGLSIAVGIGNKLRWADGIGIADLENNVHATKETAYRLASIDKTITATAIMQLVEAGKLDLGAPVQRYVPTFPQKQWPITARQLLTHTGGIRTYKGDEMDSTRYYPTLTEALNVFKDDPLAYTLRRVIRFWRWPSRALPE